MNIPDTRRYEMLARLSDFGAAHADLFPADSLGGQMFAAARAAVTALGQHAAAEVSSRGSFDETQRMKTAARTRLRAALDSIRRTAQAVALDTPGVDGKFRRPRGGEQALLAAARAFAQDSRAMSTAFVAHGLPSTFVDDLDAVIRAFEAAIHDHAASRAADVAARASFAAALKAGLTAVQRLDAIVPNRLGDDSARYAVWERARQVEQSPRARNSARKPPSPVAAPVPGTPDSTPQAPAV
jgi:hypothetical protein